MYESCDLEMRKKEKKKQEKGKEQAAHGAIYICTGYLTRYKCDSLICTEGNILVECLVQTRV
jgi:hypothetical protein